MEMKNTGGIKDKIWDQLLSEKWEEQKDNYDDLNLSQNKKDIVLGLISSADSESGAILLQKELFRNVLGEANVENEIIENIFLFAHELKRVLFKARITLETKK